MEKKINVVTGASGRIGFALVDLLKSKGEYVRALYYSRKDIAEYLKKVADEVVCVDIRDYDAVVKAFKGADVVYHLAGIVAIQSKITDEIREVNIEGTRNIVRACKECKVRRLVYTSTCHTLPFKNNEELLYEIPYCDPDKVHGAYARSKSIATNIVHDAVKNDGLDAVIGLPTGVIGPFEYKRSNLGQAYIDVARKKLPAYVSGRYDFVDTRDVASGLYGLAQKGVKGECYNLSGHISTVKEMIQWAAEAANVKPPKLCMPLWFIKLFAGMVESIALSRGKIPTFTPYSMKVLGDNCNFPHDKITKLTGYNPRPNKEAIMDQVKFYLEVGKNLKG